MQQNATKEVVMPSDRRVKPYSWILGIAIALATSGAWAATSTLLAAAPDGPMNVADNSDAQNAQGLYLTPTPRAYRPGEAGVRKAAMQGPEALRRYIWRTRMIYDYYYWDFVTRDE
jgi:hypothetical protein